MSERAKGPTYLSIELHSSIHRFLNTSGTRSYVLGNSFLGILKVLFGKGQRCLTETNLLLCQCVYQLYGNGPDHYDLYNNASINCDCSSYCTLIPDINNNDIVPPEAHCIYTIQCFVTNPFL